MDVPSVLKPGETCWRIEKAGQLAVIIDAADYFAALRNVLPLARHSVIMIGWEFDTRISLDPREPDGDVPQRMGDLLSWLVDRRPDLKIRLLQWDVGLIGTLERGSTPLRLADWLLGRQISLKLDHAHPSGAAHHQKIIVIDDTLAFCGGIDITADRWDDSSHADDNPLRVRPTSKRPYKPWHDATTAVDGEVARALGELCRMRWANATGESIEPPQPVPPMWPEGIEPMLTDVPVAVSRTAPEYAEREAIHEIEALYLTVIKATRRTLYIESQYFASRRIAEAIVARLGDPDGPEIIIVNPETGQGWLEEEAMGSARARLLNFVRKADTDGKFRIYTPVTEGRNPIYVHAKIVIMDDKLVRVGSSNLNNRSMGFDTECDLTVEASADELDESIRQAVLKLRTALVSEHLGVEQDVFDAAIETADGSLIAAIEALRGDGRSLVPFEPPEFSDLEDDLFRENDLLDPERQASKWRWKGLRSLWRG